MGALHATACTSGSPTSSSSPLTLLIRSGARASNTPGMTAGLASPVCVSASALILPPLPAPHHRPHPKKNKPQLDREKQAEAVLQELASIISRYRGPLLESSVDLEQRLWHLATMTGEVRGGKGGRGCVCASLLDGWGVLLGVQGHSCCPEVGCEVAACCDRVLLEVCVTPHVLPVPPLPLHRGGCTPS